MVQLYLERPLADAPTICRLARLSRLSACSGHLRGSLRARHMHHHYADDASAYGISSPLFDAVFGTQPSRALSRAKLA